MTASKPNWLRLFRIACKLIRQANSKHFIMDHWTLGGGTAMMLRINHRESHDIDIFLSDPQLLSFLDPQKHDFEFEIQPDACEGDGIRSLKFVFENIGEIDFIVAGPLTDEPTTSSIIEVENVLLETLPEIIAKKIYYRGSSIKPRDIFDIAAAGEHDADRVIGALAKYHDRVAQSLAAIDKMNPEFVNAAIAELAIKDHYKEMAKTALARAQEILHNV